MILKFNGVETSIDGLSKNIGLRIDSMSKEKFTKLVEKFYKDLKDIRPKVRKYIEQEYLRRGQSNIPNMFTGKLHGNSIRHNMLLNLIYDLSNIKMNLNLAKMRADFTVPYGVDTNGKSHLVKNKKGVEYAQILNSGGTKGQFARYKGFIDNVRGEYRQYFINSIDTKYKNKNFVQEIYRY